MGTTIQLKLRQMHDSWLRNEAYEIQGYADRNDMKKFFNGLKEIYGPTTSGSAPFLSADDSALVTEKDKILEGWVQPFGSVLNRPSNDLLSQVPKNETFDALPTFEEIQKAFRLLSSGKHQAQTRSQLRSAKRVAKCWLRNSINSSKSYDSVRRLHFSSIQAKRKQQGLWQQPWNIPAVDRREGPGQSSCEPCHSPPWARSPTKVPVWFQKYRSTIKMVFPAMQLEEKCLEQNTDLYST